MEKQHQQIKLFNPLEHDFTITVDINEDGNPPSFTIHAGEAEYFPKPVAVQMRKHLADRIAQMKRKNGTWEDALNNAYKEIEPWIHQ